ncbi:MAG: WG repeat-containing protein [Chitinophagaceae bacterium]|nr:WG repeat-containing protein [Chitinophagaceae bacterium]
MKKLIPLIAALILAFNANAQDRKITYDKVNGKKVIKTFQLEPNSDLYFFGDIVKEGHEKKYLYGIKKGNKVLVEPKYSAIGGYYNSSEGIRNGIFFNKFIKVAIPGKDWLFGSHTKWGLIDLKTGKEIVPTAYYSLGLHRTGYFDGYHPKSEDTSVIVVIKRNTIPDGTLEGKTEDWVGLLDRNANEILPAKFSGIWQEETSYLATDKNGSARYDFTGKSLNGGYTYKTPLDKEVGLFVVYNNALKKGLIDSKGDLIIPLQYSLIQPFTKNLLRAEQKDTVLNITLTGCIDKNGKVIIPIKHTRLSLENNYIAAEQLDGNTTKHGLYDTLGRVILPVEYDYLGVYKGLALAKKNNKNGIIDLSTGKAVVPFKYDDISGIENGFRRVKQNDKYGYLDANTYQIALPVQYSNATGFNAKGLALVNDTDIIDKTGNVVGKTPVTDNLHGDERLAKMKEIKASGGWVSTADEKWKFNYEAEVARVAAAKAAEKEKAVLEAKAMAEVEAKATAKAKALQAQKIEEWKTEDCRSFTISPAGFNNWYEINGDIGRGLYISIKGSQWSIVGLNNGQGHRHKYQTAESGGYSGWGFFQEGAPDRGVPPTMTGQISYSTLNFLTVIKRTTNLSAYKVIPGFSDPCLEKDKSAAAKTAVAAAAKTAVAAAKVTSTNNKPTVPADITIPESTLKEDPVTTDLPVVPDKLSPGFFDQFKAIFNTDWESLKGKEIGLLAYDDYYQVYYECTKLLTGFKVIVFKRIHKWGTSYFVIAMVQEKEKAKAFYSQINDELSRLKNDGYIIDATQSDKHQGFWINKNGHSFGNAYLNNEGFISITFNHSVIAENGQKLK